MARQPAIDTPRGTIRPACCRTDEWGFPEGNQRIDERHVGIRLGDRRTPTGEWHVLLNGVDVTEGCVEAYAGEGGWVIVYDRDVTGHTYRCPFGPRTAREGAHAVVVKRFGTVQIVRLPGNGQV